MRRLAGPVVALCVASLAQPAAGQPLSSGSWNAGSQSVTYQGLSLPPDRPLWADRSVSVEGPIVWVVALLAPGIRSWHERLLAGSMQAQQRLFAVVEDAVFRHDATESADVRARDLAQAKMRLKLQVDREGYQEVETAERPDAVWIRFGYPAAAIDQAVGFALAPISTASIAFLGAPNSQPKVAEHPVWDYVWEASWAAGVVAVTALAVGVALALGH